MKIRAFSPSQMHPWRCLPALVALVLVSLGCGEDPTPRIGLTLTATPEVGHSEAPITIRSRVVNSGRLSVRYADGCGSVYVAVIRVIDPSGQVVHPECSSVGPACPPGEVDLKPGRSVDANVTFDGFLCGAEGEYPAPPGLYTVLSTFAYSYSRDGHDEGDVVEGVTTFRWE